MVVHQNVSGSTTDLKDLKTVLQPLANEQARTHTVANLDALDADPPLNVRQWCTTDAPCLLQFFAYYKRMSSARQIIWRLGSEHWLYL